MFPTDFRFRNHVFPQSLTCAYYFVRSTGGNVKIRSGNLTCFSVFPLLPKYVQKVSYLPKPSFPMAIFLYSYMKLTFEYFSWLTYMQWRLVHYISQTNIYHHKTEIHPCCIWNFIPFPAHRLVSNNAYLWCYLIRRGCKVNILVACLEGIK